MLALPMLLTSCEDILGHWERPTYSNVTPSGGDEGGGSSTEPTMLETPLTFEAKTAGAVVTFIANDDAIEKTVEYSKDGGTTWTSKSTNKTAGGIPVTLTNVGDKVMFRGTNDCYGTSTNYNYFTCSADCYVYGNVMSLINKDNYATNTKFEAMFAFRNLFENNGNIYSHDTKVLELPATTLTNYCYWQMFQGCTQLKKAPALPATTLAERCYMEMFSGCTELTAAPALPATKMTIHCYSGMFQNCKKLTTTPVLNVDCDGKGYCMDVMFKGCIELTAVAVGSKIDGTLGGSCCAGMFSGCSKLASVPSDLLPATTLASNCYQQMFQDCAKLEKAPKLPAPTANLAISCYEAMFNGCTILNEAWVKADYTNAYSQNECLNMFYNVAASGTFHGRTGNNWKASKGNFDPGINSWNDDKFLQDYNP